MASTEREGTASPEMQLSIASQDPEGTSYVAGNVRRDLKDVADLMAGMISACKACGKEYDATKHRLKDSAIFSGRPAGNYAENFATRMMGSLGTVLDELAMGAKRAAEAFAGLENDVKGTIANGSIIKDRMKELREKRDRVVVGSNEMNKRYGEHINVVC